MEPFKLTRSSAQFDSLTRAAVILVEFADQKITTTPQQWSRLVFSEEGSSVNQFYRDSSQDQFALMPISEQSGIADDGIIRVVLESKHPNNQNKLTEEVYRAIYQGIQSATAYTDLESLDRNKDYVIQPQEVIWIVVFAGYEDLYKKLGEKSSSGFSHDLMSFDKINSYQMTEFVQIGELYYEGFWLDRSSLTTHGILTHELGHILGLPDLYDTDYSSQGVGIFSLMGNGDKLLMVGGRMGEAPSGFDPWSKIYLGFVDPKIATVSGEYTLKSNLTDSPEILVIPTEVPGEYFVLENRYLEKQDKGISTFSKSGGVLIWHVDETLIFSRIMENIVNNDETHKGIDLEESSELTLGYSTLDQRPTNLLQDPFYLKSQMSLFDDTTSPSSKLNNGNASGISITIVEDGETAKIAVLLKK